MYLFRLDNGRTAAVVLFLRLLLFYTASEGRGRRARLLHAAEGYDIHSGFKIFHLYSSDRTIMEFQISKKLACCSIDWTNSGQDLRLGPFWYIPRWASRTGRFRLDSSGRTSAKHRNPIKFDAYPPGRSDDDQGPGAALLREFILPQAIVISIF